MAQRTLSVLTHPSFPQVFAAAISQSVNRVCDTPQLTICCYQDPESSWGACDGGYLCNELAVVHDVSTELDYCFKHYRMVSRG